MRKSIVSKFAAALILSTLVPLAAMAQDATPPTNAATKMPTTTAKVTTPQGNTRKITSRYMMGTGPSPHAARRGATGSSIAACRTGEPMRAIARCRAIWPLGTRSWRILTTATGAVATPNNPVTTAKKAGGAHHKHPSGKHKATPTSHRHVAQHSSKATRGHTTNFSHRREKVPPVCRRYALCPTRGWTKGRFFARSETERLRSSVFGRLQLHIRGSPGLFEAFLCFFGQRRVLLPGWPPGRTGIGHFPDAPSVGPIDGFGLFRATGGEEHRAERLSDGIKPRGRLVILQFVFRRDRCGRGLATDSLIFSLSLPWVAASLPARMSPAIVTSFTIGCRPATRSSGIVACNVCAAT